MLEISYDKIEQLYYQNPKFGFCFLRLSTARLFDNIKRLESALRERDEEVLSLKKALGVRRRVHCLPPCTRATVRSGQRAQCAD
jgi:hypothetical protein